MSPTSCLEILFIYRKLFIQFTILGVYQYTCMLHGSVGRATSEILGTSGWDKREELTNPMPRMTVLTLQ